MILFAAWLWTSIYKWLIRSHVWIIKFKKYNSIQDSWLELESWRKAFIHSFKAVFVICWNTIIEVNPIFWQVLTLLSCVTYLFLLLLDDFFTAKPTTPKSYLYMSPLFSASQPSGWPRVSSGLVCWLKLPKKELHSNVTLCGRYFPYWNDLFSGSYLTRQDLLKFYSVQFGSFSTPSVRSVPPPYPIPPEPAQPSVIFSMEWHENHHLFKSERKSSCCATVDNRQIDFPVWSSSSSWGINPILILWFQYR